MKPAYSRNGYHLTRDLLIRDLLISICLAIIVISVAASAASGSGPSVSSGSGSGSGSVSGESPSCNCSHNTDLESWLASKKNLWEKRLVQVTGYERPSHISVCRVTGGGPRCREGCIYLPPLPDEEELRALTHEYVHLAFLHHPLSRDEGFVERTARTLISGDNGDPIK